MLAIVVFPEPWLPDKPKNRVFPFCLYFFDSPLAKLSVASLLTIAAPFISPPSLPAILDVIAPPSFEIPLNPPGPGKNNAPPPAPIATAFSPGVSS